ncbi:hypothetical protein F4860DRAFT_122029 [Xylaria cubensis]|nr:hypothetical protein F4860DRAFT_122029 [Xylaria cubensis]
MPKPLLKAALLGVLAAATDSRYPRHDQLRVSKNVYACDGPGTYAANIAVEGRHGRGCTGNELRLLVGDLKKYLNAYKVWERAKKRGEGIQQGKDSDCCEFALQVDEIYGKAKDGTTQYIQSDAQRGSVEALRSTLADMTTNAGVNEPVAQLLSYYGCSDYSIESSGKNYKPPLEWSKNKGNYTHWLLMSLMKNRGLDPDVRVTPVIRIWEQCQLSASEIIGTALGMGGSRVKQQGLNVVPPGRHHGSNKNRDYQVDRKAAIHYRRHLMENLEETKQVLGNRITTFKYLEKWPLSGLEELESKLDRWKMLAEKFRIAKEELEGSMDRLDVILAEGQRVSNLSRALIGMMKNLLME